MIYIGYSDDYEVCTFVYRFSDFLKVTIILIYIRHVRIKFDKDCVLKVIMECVFSNNM